MKFGKFFKPMLLTEVEKPFDDENYIFELKFDGIRAIIHVGPKMFKIYSRNGIDITKIYPELKNIQNLVSKNTILDGEIVSFKDGKPSFSLLQKRNHLKKKKEIEVSSVLNPVCFIAFDCLYENKDLTKLPLLERKKILNNIEDTDNFIKTIYLEKNGKKLFKRVKKQSLEGIVAKKKNSTYTIDFRTDDWIKIKNLQKKAFYIGGYSLNKVNATLYLGEYKGNNFSYVGKVSISKTNPFFKKLSTLPKIDASPFKNKTMEETVYVNPTLSCEVKYLERTENGSLRQPIFSKEAKE